MTDALLWFLMLCCVIGVGLMAGPAAAVMLAAGCAAIYALSFAATLKP